MMKTCGNLSGLKNTAYSCHDGEMCGNLSELRKIAYISHDEDVWKTLRINKNCIQLS
jgi:hypothetical protein